MRAYKIWANVHFRRRRASFMEWAAFTTKKYEVSGKF